MNVERVVCIILDGDLDSNCNKTNEESKSWFDIVSVFEWIGFPWSKVRWWTNVAVLLLDFFR